MKIYVAGKTHDLEKVREVQALCRKYGHSITHDWTAAVEEHGPDHEGEPLTQRTARNYAAHDLLGVLRANLVIVVPHEKLCGTLIEIGAACATQIPVLILGTPHQRSVFWALDNVMQTIEEWPTCRSTLEYYFGFGYTDRLVRVPINGRQ